MIITFCGHALFKKTDEYEKKILTFLEEKIGNDSAEIYFGDNGDFDAFAYECCKKYKNLHSNVSLVFVTPYLNLKCSKEKYDFIIYPEIENKPPRFAIIYRNRYMIKKADYVIAYVSHAWGGAYKTYKYAKRQGKCILNLADFDEWFLNKYIELVCVRIFAAFLKKSGAKNFQMKGFCAHSTLDGYLTIVERIFLFSNKIWL